MEKDYEKLFAVKYVLQKEALEKLRRNRKHNTEFENVFYEVAYKELRPIRKYKVAYKTIFDLIHLIKNDYFLVS